MMTQNRSPRVVVFVGESVTGSVIFDSACSRSDGARSRAHESSPATGASPLISSQQRWCAREMPQARCRSSRGSRPSCRARETKQTQSESSVCLAVS